MVREEHFPPPFFVCRKRTSCLLNNSRSCQSFFVVPRTAKFARRVIGIHGHSPRRRDDLP
jgi:hypothetical protein